MHGGRRATARPILSGNVLQRVYVVITRGHRYHTCETGGAGKSGAVRALLLVALKVLEFFPTCSTSISMFTSDPECGWLDCWRTSCAEFSRQLTTDIVDPEYAVRS